LAVYKTGRQRGYAALNWKKSDHRGIFAGFQMPLSSTFGCTGKRPTLRHPRYRGGTTGYRTLFILVLP